MHGCPVRDYISKLSCFFKVYPCDCIWTIASCLLLPGYYLKDKANFPKGKAKEPKPLPFPSQRPEGSCAGDQPLPFRGGEHARGRQRKKQEELWSNDSFSDSTDYSSCPLDKDLKEEHIFILRSLCYVDLASMLNIQKKFLGADS